MVQHGDEDPDEDADEAPGKRPDEPGAAPASGGPVRLDIVIPLFDEQENLPVLVERLRAACETLGGIRWRVIFVDDGSRDDTGGLVDREHERDGRFCAVHLSRNFGHQAAITAGLAHADGDAVVTMDGDLQDPPEVIPELVASWRGGAQVVRAQRRSRAERGFRRIGFFLFHRFFSLISDAPIPARVGIFGLMDRRVVRTIQGLGERNRYFPGLRWWVGFEQASVAYDRQGRASGEPKQSLLRLVAYGLDGVFSFSYKPLRLMTFGGLAVTASGLALAAWFVAKRLAGVEVAETGFTTLVTLILLLGGAQIAAIGIVGEYIARIYDEVKRRPLYVVDERVGLEGPDAP